MRVVGSYHEQGYALIERLIPAEVAQAFLAGFKNDLGPGAIPLSQVSSFPNLLTRPALEVYGRHYPPMLSFLWGLTPVISEIVGKDLLPTYDYLRIYREGDICRVHYDRPSCEHSVSLTLDYSDGVSWNLDVGHEDSSPSSSVDEDFGAEEFTSVPMQVGDAVLYRGVNHRHGRLNPNPNAWSAHLFLHWVDRDGPYRNHAFDGASAPKVNFEFA